MDAALDLILDDEAGSPDREIESAVDRDRRVGSGRFRQD
jgi:hypothetical protein